MAKTHDGRPTMANHTTGRIVSKSIVAYLIWMVVLLAGNQAFSQTPLQKVTLSYSSSGITSIEFFIAKEKKFFQEEGLEPLLIQMSANTAIAAGVTGELTGLSSIGSAIRAIQRGAPLRVVSVSLRRPIFWLVSRPEYRSVKDLKGKVLATATIGGSQHTAAKKMISLGGLDPDKDLTTIAGGEESSSPPGFGQQHGPGLGDQPALGSACARQIQNECSR